MQSTVGPSVSALNPAVGAAAAHPGVSGWVRVIQATWIAVLCVQAAILITGLPIMFRQLSTVCLDQWCASGQVGPEGLRRLEEAGWTLTTYAVVISSLTMLIAVLGGGLATLMVARGGDDAFGLALAVGIGSCALNASGASWALHSDGRLELWQLAVLYSPSVVVFGGFLDAFYPRGSYVLAGSWLIVPWSIAIFVLEGWPTLLGTGAWTQWLVRIETYVVPIGLLGLLALRRLRTPEPAARAKLRWVMFSYGGVLLIWSTMLAAHVFPRQFQPGHALGILQHVAWALGVIVTILMLSLAVLDHRLTGIRGIINRSLVYAALTASLLIIYVTIVATAGAVLNSAADGVVASIATLSVALAFLPLRDRFSRGINRLLFGHRDDPYGALSRLSREAGTDLLPQVLLTRVAATIQDAMRVPFVAIQTEPSGIGGATAGVRVGEVLRLPLSFGPNIVGVLEIATRAPGERFTAADRRLLDDLCRQAGLVLQALHLNIDLQRSRERIVTAREEERRRLRRDLHDGIGATLASLTLQAEIARDLVNDEPARSVALLDDIVDQTQSAISDVRRLVYDLRPPALDDLGFAGAIQALCARSETGGVRISLVMYPPDMALPAAVEVAAYRILQEALTNVLRHAGATEVTVAITIDARTCLVIEVTDNGRGMTQPIAPGVGLSSMRERAMELRGYFDVTHAPGGGVRTKAILPTALEPGMATCDAP